MKPVQVMGHVDQHGKLELPTLPAFPPGEDLRVLIMETASVSALGKMVDLLAGLNIADSELLEQLEALDEALWDIQFASSPDVLEKLAKQALKAHQGGKTTILDFEEMK